MTVTLELRGSTVDFGEDLDEAVLTLKAGRVPLAWLSLLTEADLQRPDFWENSSASVPVSWAAQVHAAFTNPDLDGIPPLEIPWSVARARLRSAVSRLQDRNDPWAASLAGWEQGLLGLAAQGPALRAMLDLEAASDSSENADAFLGTLLHGVRWWAEPDGILRPRVDSETELTGGLFDDTLAWRAGRSASVAAVLSRTPGERVVNASVVVPLSTVTLMAYWITGSIWWAGTAFLLVVASITWGLFRKSNRGAGQISGALLTLRPVPHPVMVRPPLLPVLVCLLLLLGGLLDLWSQLHRVQGACCSRAYYNYWPSRTWAELWVIGVLILLGVVSQTVRLRGNLLTVTWLFGLLRMSRPAEQVTVEAVCQAVPNKGEKVSGLRLRLGRLGVTLADGQPGYAALRAACTERPGPFP